MDDNATCIGADIRFVHHVWRCIACFGSSVEWFVYYLGCLPVFELCFSYLFVLWACCAIQGLYVLLGFFGYDEDAVCFVVEDFVSGDACVA